MDSLKWLEQWYSALCKDEWHEYYGVNIRTLDNPGWIVEIDIIETILENKLFQSLEHDNGEGDWVYCRVENGKFIGAGDMGKLTYIVDIFRAWNDTVSTSHIQ